MSNRSGLVHAAAPLALLLLLQCAGGLFPAVQPSGPADLLVVDCLLPPKSRRLGEYVSYISARRQVKLPALECRRWGGEYTEPEGASAATALQIWLPAAQAGDREA